MAWNSSTDFDTSTAIDGYGIGVRFLVPFVDVIRVDVAWGQPGRARSDISAHRQGRGDSVNSATMRGFEP